MSSFATRNVEPSFGEYEPINAAGIRYVVENPYTFPGGYISIGVGNGFVLCPRCIKANYRRVLSDSVGARADDHGSWRINATTITQYDEHELTCDNCYAVIVECWMREEEEDCPEGCSRAEADFRCPNPST